MFADFCSASSQWHIGCLSCTACGNRPDLKVGILVDGSILCSHCITCNACKNRIEYTVISAGSEKLCINCFRCRKCTRQILGLRYVRKSGNILCISCYESLATGSRRNNTLVLNPYLGGSYPAESMTEIQVESPHIVPWTGMSTNLSSLPKGSFWN